MRSRIWTVVWPVVGASMSLAVAPPERNAGRGREGGERPGEPTGYTIRGPNFHVWDEDREAAESWAFELADAWASATVPAPHDDE